MHKINFLAELFESEIHNASRFNHHSEEFLEKLKNVIEARKELDSLLNGKEKEQFWKYADLQEQYVAENEFESFSNGFRLGASCMLDVFTSK